MFSLLAKRFEPNFPIIELEESPTEVESKLASFSTVEKLDRPEEEGIDFCFVCEDEDTRINVGFSSSTISYVNYLTNQFNRTSKQKAEKLNWFINHYGSPEEFEEPNNTGYMVFYRNPSRKLTIVLGLHKGPVRINNHVSD